MVETSDQSLNDELYVYPSVSAESSITFKLFSFAKLAIFSQSAIFPIKLGTQIAETFFKSTLLKIEVSICIVLL